MALASVLDHWNDILTVLAFVTSLVLGFYQIRYYRNQQPSLDIVEISDAEYTDFEEYTKYGLTVRLKNDGRDPVFIPEAKLTINGEDIDLNNETVDFDIKRGKIASQLKGREFRTIQLGANEFNNVEFTGTGGPVDVSEPLTGTLRMKSSVGDVKRSVDFSRAP